MCLSWKKYKIVRENKWKEGDKVSLDHEDVGARRSHISAPRTEQIFPSMALLLLAPPLPGEVGRENDIAGPKIAYGHASNFLEKQNQIFVHIRSLHLSQLALFIYN